MLLDLHPTAATVADAFAVDRADAPFTPPTPVAPAGGPTQAQKAQMAQKSQKAQPPLAATPTARYHDAGALNLLVLQLHEAARAIDEGDPAARPLLRGLIDRLQAARHPQATGLMVFAQALAMRLDDGCAEQANLYLRRFEVPQITLFNLLGRAVPMVGMATQLSNDVLARAIRGQSHPVLIDVGIGTGRQVAALLAQLAQDGALPPAMTVVGIEPAAEALAQAGRELQALAAQLGVALHWHPVACAAEAMDAGHWAAVAARVAQGSGAPAINASFALHHIADDAQGQDQRDRVLRALRALRPVAFVIAEPDSDHLGARFYPRFRQCLAHFGAVFRVLDALPLAPHERDALKVGFFGREVADVLATPDAQRSERHERAAAWAQRLRRAGFALREPGVPLPASGHPAVQAELRGPRVAIRGAQTTLVSVFVAEPAPAGG